MNRQETRRLIHKTDHVAVFDNFLKKADMENLNSFISRLDYSSVHTEKWQRVWRLCDGAPLVGPTWTFEKRSAEHHAGRPGETSGSSMTKFLDHVMDLAKDAHAIVANPVAWVAITAAPWVYPAGTGLSLHSDGPPNFTGSYVYFSHKRWNIHWGGQLLIMNESTSGVFAKTGGRKINSMAKWLDDSIENELMWEPGLALCIFPKPNRIVFIGPKAQHLITRINDAAGQNARISVSGFFQPPPLSQNANSGVRQTESAFNA